jgi:hypothetical protein
LGLAYWNDSAKLLCFSMVFLGFPSMIITFYGCYLTVEMINLYNSKFNLKRVRKPHGNGANRGIKHERREKP